MSAKFKNKDIFITNDKIFSHLETLNSWKKGVDISPVTVEVHPTESCANRCFYCKYPKAPMSISLDDFKIVIKKLSQVKTKAVILSGGGEPTLHPDISDAIRTITKAEMNSAIITNLFVKDESLYTTILRDCTWCRISLDASCEKIYRKIRGANGFKHVVSNIQRLVRLKKKLKSKTTIGIQSVINKYNIDDIFNEIKVANQLKVDYIQIRPVETMPGEQLIYSKQQYDHIMEQIEIGRKFERGDFRIIRSNKWDIINPYLRKRGHGFSFCHAFMMIAAVDVRGDVYVCCHQIENRNKRLCYGNIIKEPMDVIMSRRKTTIKNLDLTKCYLECRASNINRRLESLKRAVPHANFL